MPEGAHKGGLFLFFCLGLIAGVALFSAYQHEASPETIDFYIGKAIEAQAEIISEPLVKGKDSELDIAIRKLAQQDSVSGKIRVRTNRFPILHYGDIVTIQCRLEAPQNTTFNYQRYLARYGIYSICYKAKIKKIGEGGGSAIKKKLFDLKNYSKSIIEKYINEPESSLIGPVLFGGGDELGETIVEKFRRTGLTHIMAVSGFNVGILAAGVAYLLFLLGLRRKIVFIVSSVAVISYVVLVGAPPSAVRAGIMSILILFSLSVGRISRLVNIVIITAAGTLLCNPLLVSADIGWQLSFAAVLGLIYLYPLIKKILDKIIWKRLAWLSDVIAATLAAQFSTTPISLYHFGQVSIISPLSNILVVWTISFLTAVSAFAIPLAALFPVLGNIFFLPSFIIAKYIMWIVSILSLPSWAAFSIDK